jgi:hypothetical protein
MKVRLITDGRVIQLGEFKRMYPDTSWPADDAVFTPDMISQFATAHAVLETAQPTYNSQLQKLTLGECVWDAEDNLYRDQWVLEDLPQTSQNSNKAGTISDLQVRIKARRDYLIANGGYKVSVEGVDKWFHSDTTSQLQQVDLADEAKEVRAGGGDMSVPFPNDYAGGPLLWKTMDKTYVPMTPALALAVRAAAKPQAIALHSYAQMLCDIVAEASEPTTVAILAGWPETFVMPEPSPA